MDGDPADDVDPHMRSFFMTNKDLFEYDKYVGQTDPFDPACSSPSHGPSLSFLDRYRECSERSSCCNDDTSYLLAVPGLTSSILSISLPSTTARSPPRANYRGSLASPTAMLPLDPASAGAGLSLHNRQCQQRDSKEQRFVRLASYQPGVSPPSPLSLRNGKQQFALDANLADHLSEFSAPPAYKQRASHHESAKSSPEHWQHPTSSSTSRSLYSESPPRQQQTGSLLFGQTRAAGFRMPAVTQLLIDSSARRQYLAERQVDQAAKIELLTGGKCVGRVSAASRNLPPSIRKRLEASGSIAARRERLYNVLLRDYQQLAGR